MINKRNNIFGLLVFWVLFAWSCSNNNFDYSIPPQVGSSTSSAQSFRDGITRISNDSLAFKLFAPGKNEIYLIGSFNKWAKSEAFKMQKEGDRFFIKVGGLDPSKEYICQYLIDDKIRVADPYASKISDPDNDKYISSSTYPNLIAYPEGQTTDIAMVVSTATDNYKWSVTDFKINDPQNMSIYELYIRDFTGETSDIGTIKAAKEKIPYLKSLGINTIELLPFNEFEGNSSWGYNPSFYFVTDKAYGTKDDYKDFIDACHKEGIGVIMDMVLNHSYGQNPLVKMYVDDNWKISANNPYFNVESPNQVYSWGYDFNHESVYTQQLVDSICSFWMSEFKLDGFRFDFTKGFTNTPGDGWAKDDARINILKRMSTEIWKRNPDAVVILEHLTENSEEKILSDHGIYLWGNMNPSFNEATMGWGDELDNNKYKGDVSWVSYKERGWTNNTLVTYMESHDEERLMYKNEQWGKEDGTYNAKDIATGLQRSAAAAVIYLSLPGPKMIWQFGELGYGYKLGSNMEDGRLDPKPARWDYLEDVNRKDLHDVYSKMLALRNSNSTFSTQDYEMDLVGNFKQVLLKGNQNVCVLANFDTQPVTTVVNFGKVGTWKEQFTNESLSLTNATSSVTLQPGEYRVYINN